MVTWTQEEWDAWHRQRAVAAAKVVSPPAPPVHLRPSTDEEKLNKTERAYLQYLRLSEIWSWIGIQCVTLKLANDTRYTPDFFVIGSQSGQVVAKEVKGFFRDDAKVKIKVAARMFPWISFELVRKDGHGWKIEHVNP